MKHSLSVCIVVNLSSAWCHHILQNQLYILARLWLVHLVQVKPLIAPYPCAVDISELITLDDVMDSLKLGPNGGLIYSMEYLEANLDWLENKLKHHHDCYFLFDCPGQVELYTHHNSVKNIFAKLSKWNFRVSTWWVLFLNFSLIYKDVFSCLISSDIYSWLQCIWWIPITVLIRPSLSLCCVHPCPPCCRLNCHMSMCSQKWTSLSNMADLVR